jgi:hypothetical protein
LPGWASVGATPHRTAATPNENNTMLRLNMMRSLLLVMLFREPGYQHFTEEK